MIINETRQSMRDDESQQHSVKGVNGGGGGGRAPGSSDASNTRREQVEEGALQVDEKSSQLDDSGVRPNTAALNEASRNRIEFSETPPHRLQQC